MQNVISLADAVNEIYRTCKGLPKSPFFFIVGAGLSAPNVKTAGQLIRDFKAIYEAERVRLKLPDVAFGSASAMNEYSFWFEKAFTSPIQRRNFLKSEMRNKAPSPAILRFVHLLAESDLAKFVVTPNFDDLLTKALTLFGVHPIVCDHPSTASRLETDDSSEVQILHVHGTYHFYDACNLTSEISQRSSLSNNTQTMAMILTQVFSHRSPIVIGYSGWEEDVIMSVMEERLKYALASNIYWFCYSVDSYNNLPEWLRLSEHVKFILPEQPMDASLEISDAQSHVHDREPDEEEVEVPMRKVLAGRLEAVEVLDALNDRFDIDEPLITSDPFEYLVKLLIPMTSSSELDSQDSYSFNNVIDRLKAASAKDLESRLISRDGLEPLRSALRRSKSDEACDIAMEITLSEHFTEVLASSVTSAEFIQLFSEAARDADVEHSYVSIDSLFDAYARVASPNDSGHFVLSTALAISRRLNLLHRHDDAQRISQKAIDTLSSVAHVRPILWSEIIFENAKTRLIEDSADFDAQAKVMLIAEGGEEIVSDRLAIDAMMLIANLGQLRRDPSLSLQWFKRAVDRIENSDQPLERYAEALWGVAKANNRLKNFKDTLRYVRKAEKLLPFARSVREKVAFKRLFVSKGNALRSLDRKELSIAAFEEILNADSEERFLLGPHTLINAMQQVARLNAEVGRRDLAVHYYEDAIALFGKNDDAAVQLHVRGCRRELERLQAQQIDLLDSEEPLRSGEQPP